MKKGNLFVVSAPSGAGKTTLCRKIEEALPGIRHSVSYTTRKPRPGEADGRDYFFIEERAFRDMAEAGEFVEWAVVHGNYYGTSKRKLLETLEAGTDLILDIDTQGARHMKETFPDGVYIFVLPPSMAVLKERLGGRMTDSEEEIRKRLKRAKEEIRQYSMYDYVIVNDVFDKALADIRAIVEARRGGRPATAIKGVDAFWVEKNFSEEDP